MKQNLQLLLFSVALSLLVAEIGFRANGKYTSYNERTESGSYVSPFDAGDDGWIFTYKPFTEIENVKSEFSYSWVTNNEGLRDKNISVKKSGMRVMVFGDSFTEGAGAPNDSCYPRILENLLRTNSYSMMQVVNCGASSSDIFFEYKLLALKMLRYQPDYVLVTFNSTDHYDFLIRGGFERFKADNKLKYRTAPWFEPLYAYSYIVRRVVHDVYGYNFDFLRPCEKNLMDDKAFKEIVGAIDSFQNLCNSHCIKFGIIFHPLPHEFTLPRDYRTDKLINYCKENNIDYADELPCLQKDKIEITNWEKIYWPIDGHFNSKGYELLAQCVYEFMKKQNWITQHKKEALKNTNHD